MRNNKKVQSIKAIDLKATVRYEKLYPLHAYKVNSEVEYPSVNLGLTKEQAVKLATRLLMAAEDWDNVWLYFNKKANSVTVNSLRPVKDEE